MQEQVCLVLLRKLGRFFFFFLSSLLSVLIDYIVTVSKGLRDNFRLISLEL